MNDKFNNLYQQAKRDRQKKLIEQEIQKTLKPDPQCTFKPKINIKKFQKSFKEETKTPEKSNRKPSKQESIPEITANFQVVEEDLDDEEEEIQELKIEMHKRADSQTLSGGDSTPVRIENMLHKKHKLTETPKTEELEEEMRDQVLDCNTDNFLINVKRKLLLFKISINYYSLDDCLLYSLS